MSRGLVLFVLLSLLPVCAPATVTPSVDGKRAVANDILVAAEPAAGCEEKCLADEGACLVSESCTTRTPEEQKECKRTCEQLYTFCLAEC